MVGDSQRITISPIAELELALEVGAPQIIGSSACGQRRAARAVARPAATLNQAMAVEDRMDGAFGRNPDIAVEPSDQQFPDLASVSRIGPQISVRSINGSSDPPRMIAMQSEPPPRLVLMATTATMAATTTTMAS